MSHRTRALIMAATTVLVIALVNLQIAGKEHLLREGTLVLLRLAPVDPRSLMQGDYMALRYAMAGEVAEAAASAGMDDGSVVVQLDGKHRARFVGLYRGQQLGPRQHLLQFRRRGDSVRLASDAYFFEEGHGEAFAEARFGELRVGDDGEAVLTGLRTSDARPLP